MTQLFRVRLLIEERCDLHWDQFLQLQYLDQWNPEPTQRLVEIQPYLQIDPGILWFPENYAQYLHEPVERGT